jgi:hypothetical protein
MWSANATTGSRLSSLQQGNWLAVLAVRIAGGVADFHRVESRISSTIAYGCMVATSQTHAAMSSG